MDRREVRAGTPRLHAADSSAEAASPVEVGRFRLEDRRERVGLPRQEVQRKDPSARLAAAAARQWHLDGFRTRQADGKATDARSRQSEHTAAAVAAPDCSHQPGDLPAVIVVDVREELVKLNHQHIRHVRDGFLE
jgi:hypothetical protein